MENFFKTESFNVMISEIMENNNDYHIDVLLKAHCTIWLINSNDSCHTSMQASIIMQILCAWRYI